MRVIARLRTLREGHQAKDSEQGKGAGEKARPPGSRLRLILWVTFGVLVVGLGVLLRYTYVAPAPGRELALDEIYDLAAANRLQKVTLLDEQAVIVGAFCLAPPAEAPPRDARPRRCYDVTKRFHTSYPSSQVSTQELISAIRASGADLKVDPQTPVAMARFVSSFLFPLLMLANLLALIFLGRGGDGGAGEIAGFSRMGKKRKEASSEKVVTFAQVAGAEEAVAELQEVIDYLTDPARFQAYGASPPKGVMLFGPPGCGKTLLARATAGESGVPFFSVAGTEFVESLVGVGAARVRDLFRQVREAAPAIVFIDEIDAVGRRRSGEGSSGGEREQTLNQLLVELDGFEISSGVVLMGASNRPDILDPALLRPGRFDRHITMEAPDVEGRRAILELHAAKRPIGPDVDFESVARRTPGFTGADLANVMNEGALLAIRQGGEPISAAILSEAIQRVLHGPQRRGKILSPEEKRRLAIHESSHAVVASACGHGTEVHRVTILARGKGLAQSVVDGGDRSLLTKAELSEQLAMAVAGTAGEMLVLGESSTTAADDVARATTLAREMVGLYGMSDQLGRVRLLSRTENGFLGSDDLTLEMVSGQTMADFDAEVLRLITAAEARAVDILRGARDQLDALVETLLERESIEGAELESLLAPVLAASPPTNGRTDGAGPTTARRASRTKGGST